MTVRQSLLAAAVIAAGLMSAIVSVRAQSPKNVAHVDVSGDASCGGCVVVVANS